MDGDSRRGRGGGSRHWTFVQRLPCAGLCLKTSQTDASPPRPGATATGVRGCVTWGRSCNVPGPRCPRLWLAGPRDAPPGVGRVPAKPLTPPGTWRWPRRCPSTDTSGSCFSAPAPMAFCLSPRVWATATPGRHGWRRGHKGTVSLPFPVLSQGRGTLSPQGLTVRVAGPRTLVHRGHACVPLVRSAGFVPTRPRRGWGRHVTRGRGRPHRPWEGGPTRHAGVTPGAQRTVGEQTGGAGPGEGAPLGVKAEGALGAFARPRVPVRGRVAHSPPGGARRRPPGSRTRPPRPLCVRLPGVPAVSWEGSTPTTSRRVHRPNAAARGPVPPEGRGPARNSTFPPTLSPCHVPAVAFAAISSRRTYVSPTLLPARKRMASSSGAGGRPVPARPRLSPPCPGTGSQRPLSDRVPRGLLRVPESLSW